ncbi:MAG: 3-methyl-2-oxobutanoate hydroxymethyltransferase, partial [Longimicrobiales bacterium]
GHDEVAGLVNENERPEQEHEEAGRLEAAGAFSIVLELLPAALAGEISSIVSIPTIGIGAGAGVDGQVLVLPDLLGLNDDFNPKFLRRFAELGAAARDGVRSYAEAVRDRTYPATGHSFE